MKDFAIRLLTLPLIAVSHGAALAQQDGPAAAPARVEQPYEITRAMEALQDQVVMGDGEARSKLPAMIGQIADRLLAADPAVWREPRNARAVVIYTLSGGQPRVIRKVLASGVSPEAETNAMAGTLAYVEGQEAKAKQILMPIDALAASSALGGYLALTQAALIAKSDPGRAMRLLDEARVLAPGTLVEEAALRRSAFIADEMSDLDRFIAASSRYMRRFQRSLYADNFRNRFADSVARFGLTSDPIQREKLTSLLSELDIAEQLKLYLAIAQAGILKGKIEPARFAAGQAARLSRESGLETERARFYEGVGMILTRSPQAGLSELSKIDASHLSKRDAELKEIIAKMAIAIQNAGGEAAGPSDREASQGEAAGGREDSASSSVLIEAAQTALGQTDALLKRAEP